MAKRALVIGSQTPPLEGANRDAERVAERLEALGFTLSLRVDREATREGILEGYRKLIGDVRECDAAVVYYSGHGSYEEVVEGEGRDGRVRRMRYQGIVPFDYEESTEKDFRGILAEELSILLDALTARTPNVTVLLDCCHAALMSRDPSALAKALPHPVRVGVVARLAELAASPTAQAVLTRPSNPLAVRLAASRVEQSAYEYDGADGEPCGVFTESLLIALDEARDQEVTWRDVGERVRERVSLTFRSQQPEIEGPADRLLFEVTRRAAIDSAALFTRDGRWRLRRGRIMGVHPGDVYAVLPPPTLGADSALGRARVVEVEARESEVVVDPKAGVTIPEGARAVQVESAEPPRVVVVPTDCESRDEVVEAIRRSPRFSVVAAREGAAPTLATVRVSAGRLMVSNRDDAPMTHPEVATTEALSKLPVNLERMARAQALHELSGRGLAGVSDDDLDVVWGVIVDGEERVLPGGGATLSPGDAMYFRVKNRSQRDVYVHLLDLGVSDRVTALTREMHPTGLKVSKASEALVFRNGTTGQAMPVPYFWPKSVPDDARRVEEMLFVFTAKPTDLTGLGQEGVSGAVRSVSRGASRLDQLLEQARSGVTRGAGDPAVGDDFVTRRVSFFASPWATPRGSAWFVIDDRRAAMDVTNGSPRAKAAPPRVAVVLNELVVHESRARFGADLRVDALFVTPREDGPTYAAGTMRFSEVKDGDRLALDEVLSYIGPAKDFVQVCFWVSRDRPGSLALIDMIENEANSETLKGALGALAARAVSAPRAALIVGAVGAAATLATAGCRLLSTAVGGSVGVYCTSLLEADGYRVGRHPRAGVMRAQDFSFSFEVRAVP